MFINLLVLFLFLLLTFRATFPLIFRLKTHLPGVDLGDPVHILSVIGWNYQSLSHGFKDYWNPPYFYPHRLTLAYSEHFFIPSLLVTPVIYTTGNLILAYNILILLSLTLCAFGNFLLIRYLTGSRLAGILGGIELAYSTYMLSNFAQLPYMTAQWIPFTFLYLLKFFEDRTYKNWLLFTFFYLLQVLSSAYYGLFLTVFVGIFLLIFGIRQKLFQTPGFWIQIALFLIIVLPLFGFFFYPYLVVKNQMGFQRSLGETHYFSANIRDYARVLPHNPLYGKVLYPPGVGTTSPFWLFPGITALFLGFLGSSKGSISRRKLLLQSLGILILIGLFLLFALGHEVMIFPLLIFGIGWGLYTLYETNRGTKKGIELEKDPGGEVPSLPPLLSHFPFLPRLFLICLILAFLFSFGPTLSFHEKEIPYGPYLLLTGLIPGFKGVRVVSRFNIMVTFFLGVLAGFGLVKVLNLISSKYIRGIVGIFLASFLFLEHCTDAMWIVPANTLNQTPEVYTWLKNQPGDFTILELPRTPVDILTAYYAITTHGKKSVGGYSSFIPPFTTWFFQQMETFPSENSLEKIRALGVRYVILHNRRFITEKHLSDVPLQLKAFSGFLQPVKQFPSSDTYVFEVINPRNEPFNLETTADPVKLIFPDQVPHLSEVQARLDVSIPAGDLRLSPYPEFNSRAKIRWIRYTPSLAEYSQEVHLPQKFLLSSADPGLSFTVRTPSIPGTFLLEIYDEKGKKLLDQKQVVVN
ncbi:MAG TPA: hypothetical protein VNM22_23015 [Candidatus Limnocylindrales bacterium]|nr:hypothetical protein [Candidatus Limnocylindrales bacterium]